jgi:signal transduction histidine kinase
MNKSTSLSYEQRIKLRFVEIYGYVGFLSTLSILIYFLIITTDQSYGIFTYFVGVANIVLALTIIASKLKKAALASTLAIITILLGCTSAITLQMVEFLSLTMIFILSSMFIAIGKKHLYTAYTIILLGVIIKILVESELIIIPQVVNSSLNESSIVLVNILLLSIFSYALIINKLLITGMENSEKLIKTSNKLQELVTLKNRFISLISHDLRGPVGSIATLLNAIHDGYLPADSQAIKLLRDTSNNMDDMLNNLILWSKIHRDEAVVKREQFELQTQIDDEIKMLATSASIKKIDIKNNCNKDISVIADNQMIKTVIRNLINNAIKFSYEGSSIQVDGERLDKYVKVSIQDEGVGIAQDVLSQLFDDNTDNTSSKGTSKEEGTGLGLTISKDFVEANGGEIGVISTVGKGSTFWFTIPKSDFY